MNRAEQKIQTAIVVAFRRRFDAIVTHVPNGGARTALEALAFKDAGLTAGIPDLICLDHGGRALFIEVKAQVQARDRAVAPEKRLFSLSDSQRVVVPRLRERGFTVAVVDSVDEALASAEAFGLAPKRLAPPRPEAALSTGF